MTRSPGAIGAGLAAARAARRIRPGERIHVVGAAGAGASAAALLGHFAGASVSGCDPGGPSQYTPALEAAGVRLDWEHSAAHVLGEPRPDRLAVTKALTAIEPDHPELVAARQAAIPVEPWQQVVADAATGHRLLAVAGTHGKSTTAGWLVHVLVTLGLDPGAFVGALLPAALTGGPAATARQGSGGLFVVEADEYAGNFDPYRPDLAVVTSMEWDHPDVFADLAAVDAAFDRWLRAAAAARPASVIVANVGDPNVAALVDRLRPTWPGHIVVTALVEAPPDGLPARAAALALAFADRAGPATALIGEIVAADRDGTSVRLASPTLLSAPTDVRLRTAGRHNASNALAVLATAAVVRPDGMDAALCAAVSTFAGVGRRLERVGEAGGVAVYDDYGHHPTAIRETLRAVRQREPGRRIWAVYEPLTYHRTAALLEPFAAALAEADGVAIADIWAGRDPDRTIASARGLADAVAARRPSIPVAAPGSVESTATWLAGQVRPGDAVLVMGGGRSYRIGPLLLEAIGVVDGHTGEDER